MILHIHNKLVYRSILLVALAISLGLLWQINRQVLSNPAYIPIDDFSHYWAAGRLALHGENPYDPVNIQSLRNQITGSATKYAEVPIAWTPPWSLLILIPLGALPYPLARLLWLLISISIIMVCSDNLWQIYHKDRKQLWLVWLMAFSFGPTISILQKGQITPWILAGITGFVFFTTTKPNDWMAGIFAGLISLKPQLFFLFWIALLFWVLISRRWIVLLSFSLSIVVASLPELLFNPSLVSQYIQAILYNTPKDWATPTLGGYLRLLFGIDKFYLQFLPVLIGLVWFAFYWLKNKKQWSWTDAVPATLFASILTTAYAWTYDQVILLPAILATLGRVVGLMNRKKTLIFGSLLMIVNLLDLFLHRYLDEFWFGWVAPAYLLCCLIGNFIANQSSKPLNVKAPMLQEHIE